MKRKYTQPPLDMEEPDREVAPAEQRKIWFYLEWMPISLLTIGFLLRQQGHPFWKYVLIVGGMSAVVIYLLFSQVLLHAKKNSWLQRGLSIASGLLLSVGVGSIVGQYFSWEIAEPLLRITLYGGLGLVTVVGLSFLAQIGKPENARFYRSLLARLLVFIALVYTLTT